MILLARRGPAPKKADARARRNKDVTPLKVVAANPVKQPSLPARWVAYGEGAPCQVDWPQATLDWWEMWGDAGVSAQFEATDWSMLMDTALLHARVWEGELRFAGELRLRTSKLGATIEDRDKLRITSAQAQDVEDRPKKDSTVSSRSRAKAVKVVGG